jgi:type 1 glutamine amidotransferase
MKALLVAGDNYHDPNVAFEVLSPLMQQQGAQVECTTDVTRISAEVLTAVELLTIYREGMNFPEGDLEEKHGVQWMTGAQERAIADFVNGGGSFLPMHNAIGRMPWKGPYREVTAGITSGHPPEALLEVHLCGMDHPVCRGVRGIFTIFDEQHRPWFDYDRVTLLAYSVNPETGWQTPAGWAYQYGKGRVLYLANGHTRGVLTQPDYHLLIANGIRWLLHQI